MLKIKLIHNGGKQIIGYRTNLLTVREVMVTVNVGEAGRGRRKGLPKVRRGNLYVYYLDCGEVFTGINKC